MGKSFGIADGLVNDDALLVAGGEFFSKCLGVNHAADDGVQPFGCGVEVDVLVCRAYVQFAASVIHGGVEQVNRGVLDVALLVAERDEVFVIYLFESIIGGVVAPGTLRGEYVEPHVLSAAGGRDGAFAVGVDTPSDPQDFAERLVIDFVLGIILAAYRDFENRIALLDDKLPALEQVRIAIDEKIGKFTKSEIMELVPGVGRASVENSLKKLTEEGVIDKHGSGKSTFYTRRD